MKNSKIRIKLSLNGAVCFETLHLPLFDLLSVVGAFELSGTNK